MVADFVAFTCYPCIVTVNKRLDEWVPEERMDVTKAELPKKDAKTPKKEPQTSKLTNGSRPASPEVGVG